MGRKTVSNSNERKLRKDLLKLWIRRTEIHIVRFYPDCGIDRVYRTTCTNVHLTTNSGRKLIIELPSTLPPTAEESKRIAVHSGTEHELGPRTKSMFCN